MSKVKEAPRGRRSRAGEEDVAEFDEERTPPDKKLREFWAIMEKVGKRYRRKTGKNLSLSEIAIDLKNGR